jgi:hypothetical protein
MPKKKDNQEQHKDTGAAEKDTNREKYDVSPEEFIQTWQRADTAEEVAQQLNMPKGIVHARASNYRLAGIKLKKMTRQPKNKLDVAALNQLIEQIDKETRR